MKAFSKPLSSPGRPVDKFPPPLMRFLRTNGSSRSRGRSRSSPMFYVRTRRALPGVIEPTHEPSSPKVTCMGQVRVQRRSAKSGSRKTGVATMRLRLWWWLKRSFSCCKFSSRFRNRKRPITSMLWKWSSFSWSGYCKKIDATEDSFRAYKIENFAGKSRNSSSNNSESNCCGIGEHLEIGADKRRRDSLQSSSSPPRNALILTRCRSAPYRSSSLGGRFWGSPFFEKGRENEGKTAELQKPSSETAKEEETRNCREIGKSVKNVDELKIGVSVHPLLLTRCKSEPARTGERLNPTPRLLRRASHSVNLRPERPSVHQLPIPDMHTATLPIDALMGDKVNQQLFVDYDYEAQPVV